MCVKNTRIVAILGLFVWAIIAGRSGLSAAEPPAAEPAAPLRAEPDTILAESIPAEPIPAGTQQGGCLDLLDSGEQTSIIPGEYSDCGDCVDSGPWQATDSHRPSGLWYRGDYLLWWTRPARLPPLVTTGGTSGVLGQPGTEVLFGDSTIHRGGRSSFRTRLGYWLDYCETVGLEAEYYNLGEPTTRFSRTSPGDPLLARPYYDVVAGIESAQAIAVPSVAVGDVSVESSDYFSSVGVHVRTNLCCFEPAVPADCYPIDDCGDGCGEYGRMCDYTATGYRNFRLDLVGGYRHYRLTDRLTIGENIVSTGPPNVVGTMFNITEEFYSANEFNGGELGALAQFNRGPWSLELSAAMMMGNNHRVVTVIGSTATTTPGFSTIHHTGGLLALPTNIGMYRDDRFVVIPQFGAEVGYQLNGCLRVFAGYNFLYWANVARSGDQIDLGVNPSQIPPGTLVGEARPRFRFNNSDFWAQGMNLGLELRY